MNEVIEAQRIYCDDLAVYYVEACREMGRLKRIFDEAPTDRSFDRFREASAIADGCWRDFGAASAELRAPIGAIGVNDYRHAVLRRGNVAYASTCLEGRMEVA